MTLGIFTTIKIKNGIPLFLDKHLDRLLFQAKKVHVGDFELSQEIVQDYVQKNNLTDCALKITVTKQHGKPTILMQSRPWPESLTAIKLLTVPDTRDEYKIYKTTNRTINDQAKRKAQEKKADDAVFTLQGNIMESTIGNIFSLNKKGQIVTPNLNNKGLPGIARQIILEYVHVVEESIPQKTTNPLVIVNSLRIQYATHLNGRPLADGKPLMQTLRKAIETAEKTYLATIH